MASMADDLIYQMSSQSEGTPSVFTKKDWLSILDNQNQSYNGNQSVIDTSQLANSNKFINYREGYLTIPLLLTATALPTSAVVATPASAGGSLDYAVGLKNWYGSIIHSFTVDYNGTTIIQQTPYIGLWNTFRLMTSLSLDDIITQGSTIGFYPDTATSVGATSITYAAAGYVNGPASTAVNNNNLPTSLPPIASQFNQLTSWNQGLYRRQQYWNLDPAGIAGGVSQTYSSLLSAANMTLLWKSYVFTKINGVYNGGVNPTTAVWQCAITAQVYLKHLHMFFERIPLLKGVFMKLTCNLNQSSVNFTTTNAGALNAATTIGTVSVQSPLGGVSPIMLASGVANNGGSNWGNSTCIVSLSVGKTCLNTTQTNITGVISSPLSPSILLNVPAYSFNPVFESAYLSSPVKKIVYTDVYQYQVLNIAGGTNGIGTFNNLVTNGIANIKSVLVLPFYSAGSAGTSDATVSGNGGLIPFQSPFDPCGGGPTSSLVLLTQFNIQISGQNAIYNTERYEYEQFMNQFKGVNAQNGGQEDGATSGLVGQLEFDQEYCYYYVNSGRCLPVEEAVPKSVNVLGTNMSGKNIDLYIFVEYGVEVSVDILTGARV